MRNFFVGVAVAVAIVVLVGAGMNDNAGLPTVNDLPLASAFNANFPGVIRAKPLTFTMPTAVGFVLTHLAPASTTVQVEVLINGVTMRLGLGRELGLGGWLSTGAAVHTMPPANPPLVVPPGGTLTVRPTSIVETHRYTLGGYFISRADLGL